jgi:hypothetical protein
MGLEHTSKHQIQSVDELRDDLGQQLSLASRRLDVA